VGRQKIMIFVARRNDGTEEQLDLGAALDHAILVGEQLTLGPIVDEVRLFLDALAASGADLRRRLPDRMLTPPTLDDDERLALRRLVDGVAERLAAPLPGDEARLATILAPGPDGTPGLYGGGTSLATVG